MTKFNTGSSYSLRLTGDSDSAISYNVIRRTEKTVTLQEIGETGLIRCKVYVHEGIERCKPDGAYSKSAILSAR
jgi:hypothetical protein